MFWLRKSRLEPLPVVMCGVRMGERALQIGVDDAPLVGAIAAKVGLSGHAAIAVTDERDARKAHAAAAAAGALVDVQVAPDHTLPFADASFDVVILHARAAPNTSARGATLAHAHRVLRHGGRVVIIDAVACRGAIARLGGATTGGAGDAIAALSATGFTAARLLAEREGYRFIEGIKGHS